MAMPTLEVHTWELGLNPDASYQATRDGEVSKLGTGGGGAVAARRCRRPPVAGGGVAAASLELVDDEEEEEEEDDELANAGGFRMASGPCARTRGFM